MKVSCKNLRSSSEIIAVVSAVLTVLAGFTLPVVNAQEMENDQASTWKRFAQADALISASRTTWDVTFSTPTGSTMTKQQVEQEVQRAEEKARQAGESETTAKRIGQVARDISEAKGRAFSAHTKLEFVRVGKTIRSEIHFVEAKTRGVELYDGKNSVFLETEVNGVKYSPRGYLRREAREVLSHSAPTWQTARFLTGIPLNQELSPLNPTFSPKDTTLSQGKDKTFILEKKTNPIAGQVGIEFSALLRVTLSNENFRPLSYEVMDLLHQEVKRENLGRVDVSGYKRYADNIWFPSKIVVTTPAFRSEYNLIKAEFNEAIDPAELLLPPRSSIEDSRFGPDKTIRYEAKDGRIPTDDEVRKMLGIKVEKVVEEKAAEAQVEEPKRTASLPFTSGIGLLFLSLGVVLWSRSKKV